MGTGQSLEPLARHHNGDNLPQLSADRYVKVKKRKRLGWLKCLPFPFQSRDD